MAVRDLQRRLQHVERLVAIGERERADRRDRHQAVVGLDERPVREHGARERSALVRAPAPEGPVDRSHRGQRLRAGALARQCAVARDPLAHLGAAFAEVVGRELHRLQRRTQVLLARRERSRGLAAEGGRLVRAGGEEQRAAEAVGDPSARDGVVQQLVRLSEMLGGGRPARQRLRSTQRDQHGRAAVGGRRLLQRALQVGDGGVGRAAPHRGGARVLQQRDRPRAAAARRLQQLRRDLLGRRARVVQQLRRALVQQPALPRRQLVVDRVADQRVDEPERRIRAQDLDARELARRSGHRRLLQAGQRGDRGQLRALAQHADRLRDRRRGGGEAPEPHEHRARRGARTDRADHADLRCVGRDTLGLQRAQELAQQQRVAAGRLVAGGAERVVGVRAEPLAHELGRARSGERTGQQRARRGSLTTSASSAGSAPGSPERTVAATRIGSPSRRRAR